MTKEESSQEEVPKTKALTEEVVTEETTSVCPVPAEHVKLFEECCGKYQKGEMSKFEVIDHVVKTLKSLEKSE